MKIIDIFIDNNDLTNYNKTVIGGAIIEKLNFPKNYIEETYFGFESKELLTILQTGRKEKTIPKYTRRYNGRRDWQIIYIHEGFGYFQYGNTVKKLGPYALVVFKPDEPQLYAYLPEDCPYADYLHFSGTAVEELMKKFNLNDKPYYDILPANDNVLSAAFLHLQTQCAIFRDQDHMCWNSFLDILSKLSISITSEQITPNVQFSKYANEITTILKDMHENYLSKNTVADYASMINMSTSSFAHVFKQMTGLSPIDYKNMLRLNNAKNLLANTHDSIEEIAFQSGYNSVAQFSKSFKTKFGYTPSHYRKNHNNNTTEQKALNSP